MKRFISFSIFLLLILLTLWARSRATLVSQPEGQRTAEVTPF